MDCSIGTCGIIGAAVLILVGPLIALAGIIALLLVLRTRARTRAGRSLYSAAREDRARKVREARELALRSAAPADAPAGAARVEPPRSPASTPSAVEEYPPSPAGAPVEAPISEPEPASESEPEPAEPPRSPANAPTAAEEYGPSPADAPIEEIEPVPEGAPEVVGEPAWLATPQRAAAPPAAAAARAAVDEPAWLPAQTNPPVARRPTGTVDAAAAEVEVDEEPPAPRMASTIVSYIVLAASLVVILLGIAIMIGMSRG